jgi:hypothetical protein
LKTKEELAYSAVLGCNMTITQEPVYTVEQGKKDAERLELPKTLNELLNTPRPAKSRADQAFWQDRPRLANGRLERGMILADLDGIGDENTFIPGLGGRS